jgi:hypothetical protein
LPEEELASLNVLDGFKVNLFASEADGVVKPSQMRWDERGRLWVAENHTYAESSIKLDTRLRDRVLIFADRDGDGTADERKVFLDDLQQLTSVEVGLVGVAASASPGTMGRTLLLTPGKLKLGGLLCSDSRNTRTKPCASPPPPPPKPAAVASSTVSMSRPSEMALRTSSVVFWATAESVGSAGACGLASGATVTERFSATASSPPSKKVSSTLEPASVTTISPSFRTSPS